MTKHSAEEVRLQRGRLKSGGYSAADLLHIQRMLTAYAKRIEADEGAVTEEVGWRDPTSKELIANIVEKETSGIRAAFARPSAQAAQVDALRWLAVSCDPHKLTGAFAVDHARRAFGMCPFKDDRPRRTGEAGMKDKLRELAERWKVEYSGIAGAEIGTVHVTQCSCAAELMAILDAEGDGGAVYQCMCTDSNVDSDGNEHEDDGRVWLDVPKDDFDTLSKRSDMRSRILYPHPARSGVVSDEDVRDALRAAYYYDTTERIVIDEAAMRAALESFVRNRK